MDWPDGQRSSYLAVAERYRDESASAYATVAIGLVTSVAFYALDDGARCVAPDGVEL